MLSFVVDWCQPVVSAYRSLHQQWGVIVPIVVLVLGTAVLDVTTRLLLHVLYKRVRHTETLWDDAIYKSLKGPLQIGLWIGGAWGAIVLATPTDAAWRTYLSNAGAIAFTLVLAWFAMRLIRSLGHNLLARAAYQDNKIDVTTADAIAKMLRAAVVILTALVLIDEFGASPSSLLAFSGIGGIAVGFAARDVLANIFGGVTIYLNRPFSVGEWIRSPDREIEGVVESIGWRATTVRQFDMRPLYVPNAIFSNVAIQNPSRMSHRRISVTVPIRFEDGSAIPDIVSAVRRMLEDDDAIDNDQVTLTYLDHLGENGLELMIYCYTKTLDWAEYLAIKASVLQRAQDIVREHDAAIATPVRTLHVPGEIHLARAATSHTNDDNDDREENAIDTDKVDAQRAASISRERAQASGRYGPDAPAADGGDGQ